MNEKDLDYLNDILYFCRQINNSVNRFGKEFTIFYKDRDYNNSVNHCLLHIGETIKNISEAFKTANPTYRGKK
jgi:uncharacterized protein with HEPN domain